jgi:ribosomal protein L13E
MKALAKEPIVKRTFRGSETIRTGRGYSKAELKEAGLSNSRIAKNRGIRIDVFRSSCYPENVERLRGLISSFSRPSKSVAGKHPRKKRNEAKGAPPATK